MTEKLCGHCNNFLGGGDFGLCCTKTYDLCYALDEAEGCVHYEYDENQKWLRRCPSCGKWVVWYAPFEKRELGGLLVKRYWYCQDCDETIAVVLADDVGNEYFVGEDLDK